MSINNNNTSGQEFILAGELVSHTQDVRCVCSIEGSSSSSTDKELRIGTSSRDTSVKIWSATSGQLLQTLEGHQHFVGTLISVPSSPYFPSPCIISGGNDKIINVWDIQKQQAPLLTLIGHSDTVCALSLTSQGELISGSWDKTAKIWHGGECKATLTGHAHSVWAVLGLPNGDALTGSADHTIKIWRSGQCVDTLKGHKDCVRGLAHMPGIGFISCGNDGAVILWSYGGERLQEMSGHDSFVYSVAVLPSGEIITGGEDRTLRIWKGGQTIQTIKHPGSVWSVAALPNGEIVTGCSDGVARIWSRDIHRIAPEDVLKAYEKTISAAQILPGGNEAVGGISLDKLPGLDALQLPGSRHGENKVVRNGNVAEAYQWNNQEKEWVKLGEVVTQSDNMDTDKQYDYVFDVDIGDGQIRKLGYNNHENPYTVAQEFLWREGLDQGWLDTVAQFIVKNSKPITIGDNSQTYADPFTGGQRYVPEETKSQTTQSNKFQPVHFPLKAPLVFDNANFSAILNKILEFNAEVAKVNQGLSMDKAESSHLTTLTQIISETTRYHVSTFSDAQFNVISKLLQWPLNFIFPVLDLSRLMVLHPDAAKKFAGNSGTLPVLNSALTKGSTAVNQMLALRFIANMFRWEATKKLVSTHLEEILDKFADLSQSDNKNLRLALVTAIMNISLMLCDSKKADGKMQCLSIISELVSTSSDQEETYRIFVSIGTLIWNDTESKRLLEDLEISKYLTESKLLTANKITECAKEITTYLHQ